MWRRGGYAKDFQHRLGFFHRLDAPSSGKKRIWLQAVSVGEILAIGPLIRALTADNDIEIVITTTTSTGYTEALKRYQQSTLCIGLFPLDFLPCMHLAWKRIQPDVVILTESELWPEHLHRACANSIPTFLINARISDRSFQRYKKVSGLAQRMLKKFDFIYATSDLNKNRLLELGAMPESIQSSGNIKFDVAIGKPISAAARSELCNELGFTPLADQPQAFVLLGSSTWPGEEQALLKVQTRLIEDGLDCRLLLVPRHAERASEIISLLERQPLLWHQRSTKKPAPKEVRIYLADTTGELARLTQIADLAFIGKSLPPNNGGQTPIEAAGLGIPILMGPNTSNFTEVTKSLVRSGAASIVENEHSLEMYSVELMNDTKVRESMSEAGISWHKRNRGSSRRIAEDIIRRLNLQ
ncbi:MAG: 3-deoxy-D-manno-octulosonic-acid transferase [Lentimonas sp.]|jgi:3-deoxy-D-manno-octulosonic-acid transferase